jgi:starch synthase
MPSSRSPMSICFVASEIAPLSKTGGLADVAGALPRQLHAAGHDVRVFTPFYSSIDRKGLRVTAVAGVQDVVVPMDGAAFKFSLYEGALPNSSLPIYLIDCPAFFHRSTLYTFESDEALRFLLLQRATLESCQRLKFAPQILHCNDWHTALLPLMLTTTYGWDRLFANTRSLLSIHNIGYQGEFPATTIAASGFTHHIGDLKAEDLAHGKIVWLREGIRHAHAVSTVSPTYAREICTPSGSAGMDADLLARSSPPVGILNGVDYDEWQPKTDRYLPANYDATDLSGKALVKQALLKRFDLQGDQRIPLLGMVSRLAQQKGFDLLFDSLPEILQQRELSVAVLGSGESQYEAFFRGLAKQFPRRVAFHQGYSEELAHWIEAGSDMFLMPSLYEPCGLNQLYSLKYGTIPIVRRTGGLADSVQHWDAAAQTGTGIVFNDFDVPAVRWALHTALDLFKDRAAWQRMMQSGMAQDFSWARQVTEYEALYAKMLGR